MEKTFVDALSESAIRPRDTAGSIACACEGNRRKFRLRLPPTPRKERPTAVQKYIELNYAEALSLTELAVAFFVSKEYMASSLESEIGVTINQYIQHFRLQKAASFSRSGRSGFRCAVGSITTAILNSEEIWPYPFGISQQNLKYVLAGILRMNYRYGPKPL